MGLDMYFYGKRYLWDFGESKDKEIASAIGKMFPELEDKRVKEVEVEYMYWRKANAIHNWFVETLQNGIDECQETYVDIKDLYPLRDICNEILEDESKAEKLLPSKSGFFFGNTEYDSWYFKDLQETLEFLNDIIEKHEAGFLKDWDFYYRSSW